MITYLPSHNYDTGDTPDIAVVLDEYQFDLREYTGSALHTITYLHSESDSLAPDILFQVGLIGEGVNLELRESSGSGEDPGPVGRVR